MQTELIKETQWLSKKKRNMLTFKIILTKKNIYVSRQGNVTQLCIMFLFKKKLEQKKILNRLYP